MHAFRYLTYLPALILLPGLLLTGNVLATDARLLTLDQALGIASERNRAIAKAIEFRNQAEGLYVAERAAALPRLTVKGNYAREEDRALENPIYDRSETSLQLEQTLFTWGQVQSAIRAASIGMETAEEQVRASRQDALRETSAAFFDVLLARELNSVFAQNLAQKSRRLYEARQRNRAGLATDYDVLVAEVAETNARPEVVRTDNLIRTRRDQLRLVLGIKEAVDATGELNATLAEPPDYQTAMDTARERRPELRDIRHRIAIAEELVTIARAGDKPRLDLAGNYGWKDLDAAPSDASDFSGEKWDIGIKLTWPFFDGLKNYGQVRQAVSRRESLRVDEQLLLDTVGLEIREASDRIRVASELVRALEGTVTQAQRLMQLAEKGFEFGVKIRLEVDDAELNLRQVQSSLAVARRDYLVAEVDLARAMGVLGEDALPGLPVPPQPTSSH